MPSQFSVRLKFTVLLDLNKYPHIPFVEMIGAYSFIAMQDHRANQRERSYRSGAE